MYLYIAFLYMLIKDVATYVFNILILYQVFNDLNVVFLCESLCTLFNIIVIPGIIIKRLNKLKNKALRSQTIQVNGSDGKKRTDVTSLKLKIQQRIKYVCRRQIKYSKMLPMRHCLAQVRRNEFKIEKYKALCQLRQAL